MLHSILEQFRQKQMFLLYLIIISYAFAKSEESKEFFTSIVGLDSLLNTEKILLQDLKQYIEIIKWRILRLESELNKIEVEHKQADVNTEQYLTNAVNIYRLMQRLHIDWQKYEEHISLDIARKNFLAKMQTNRHILNFPSLADIEGTALALARLQETYQLNVGQMAAGILDASKFGIDMSWYDCFVLGQQLYDLAEYEPTKLWYIEAMKRLSNESYATAPLSLDYMEYVGERLYSLGATQAALNLSLQVKQSDAERIKAAELIATIAAGRERNNTATHQKPMEIIDYHDTKEYRAYQQLCRDAVTNQKSHKLPPLHCYYSSNKNTHFSLLHYKIEEHSLDPPILTFHDIISWSAAETIKQLATPHMNRSAVRVDRDRIPTKYRISKTAYIEQSHQHTNLQRMYDVLHHITALNMSAAENVQVVNYGLGGQYEPHTDFFTYSSAEDEKHNRIATALFYLSDVAQGGATVFPHLNIGVKPKMGNVLFWFNLHHSLHVDYRTKHAACPVLHGSKWIATIWIHDVGQIFARPCNLHRDDYKSLQYATVV